MEHSANVELEAEKPGGSKHKTSSNLIVGETSSDIYDGTDVINDGFVHTDENNGFIRSMDSALENPRALYNWHQYYDAGPVPQENIANKDETDEAFWHYTCQHTPFADCSFASCVAVPETSPPIAKCACYAFEGTSQGTAKYVLSAEARNQTLDHNRMCHEQNAGDLSGYDTCMQNSPMCTMQNSPGANGFDSTRMYPGLDWQYIATYSSGFDAFETASHESPSFQDCPSGGTYANCFSAACVSGGPDEHGTTSGLEPPEGAVDFNATCFCPMYTTEDYFLGSAAAGCGMIDVVNVPAAVQYWVGESFGDLIANAPVQINNPAHLEVVSPALGEIDHSVTAVEWWMMPALADSVTTAAATNGDWSAVSTLGDTDIHPGDSGDLSAGVASAAVQVARGALTGLTELVSSIKSAIGGETRGTSLAEKAWEARGAAMLQKLKAAKVALPEKKGAVAAPKGGMAVALKEGSTSKSKAKPVLR
jgi:hypothetical protein